MGIFLLGKVQFTHSAVLKMALNVTLWCVFGLLLLSLLFHGTLRSLLFGSSYSRVTGPDDVCYTAK